MAVQTKKRNAIARLHSGAAQRARQTRYTIAKLGVGKTGVPGTLRPSSGETATPNSAENGPVSVASS